MKRLIAIQQQLKAPKNRFNDFWKYKYRSCEDILEAVKPLLNEQKLVLILDDEVVCLWERSYSRTTDDSKKWKVESIDVQWWRFYIKATAKLYGEDWKLITQTSAYAREEEEKSWQDWSQISWSSSSYARKYCLAWMFLLDSNDWIDSDTTNKWESSEKKSESKKTESKEESTETKRFNKEQFDKLKTNTEYLKKFKSSEDLLQDIYKLWYAVSKEMKMKIADVRASVPDEK